MDENLKKFLEEASKNEELKAKLTALTDKDTMADKAVEIAKEYGFTLTVEDFHASEGEALSEDEMKQVVGGTVDIKHGCLMVGSDCPYLYITTRLLPPAETNNSPVS